MVQKSKFNILVTTHEPVRHCYPLLVSVQEELPYVVLNHTQAF